MDDDPVLLDSGLSQDFEVDVALSEIHIYRLEAKLRARVSRVPVKEV